MTPQQVKQFFGTQVAIAEAAGRSQPAVCRWLKVGRVPLIVQYRLAAASKGELKVSPR